MSKTKGKFRNEECIFCGEKSEFLAELGYCKCKENKIKQKFLKKFKRPPASDLEKFHKFAKASYGGLRGVKMQSVKKRRKKKNKISCFYGERKKDFFKSKEWLEMRFFILHRDGYKCNACGRGAGDAILQVDHIIPISKRPDLALDANNLRVLCKDCNIGRLNYYQN